MSNEPVSDQEMADTPISPVSDETTGAALDPEVNGNPAPVPTNAVSDPAKLIRIGSMVQALTVEVRSASPDEAGRSLLARIHNETMSELAEVLSPDLMDELAEFQSCCESDPPTESEIRIAQAQLVGWLQGLLQGFQASAVAQQAQAMQQLQQMAPGGQATEADPRPGTYL
ncbi:MAG: DUF2587 domain-containing protein [Acidobacteria bacterium]|nr:DUF2587 domain-containing protein [Acidobacteriota bacterium]